MNYIFNCSVQVINVWLVFSPHVPPTCLVLLERLEYQSHQDKLQKLMLQDIILLEAKQSSKKSIEAEVILNRNSEAAMMIGTTDIDTDVSTEE
ncbi:hypothetical protein R3W88_001202 [Solanum pinnatisectum]|uniref:Uncharacterized protein n=1 Tax=Solanum pinnatisectum TaxID=50273 RepID=A0AAV9MKD6_9SOLN|nr:hypothetical protein R3W88_001187 [Solanum pinnatisectum]KAK4737505.1 hypothetical protein R3W88_001202 [Solanum pinnatisectum]